MLSATRAGGLPAASLCTRRGFTIEVASNQAASVGGPLGSHAGCLLSCRCLRIRGFEVGFGNEGDDAHFALTSRAVLDLDTPNALEASHPGHRRAIGGGLVVARLWAGAFSGV